MVSSIAESLKKVFIIKKTMVKIVLWNTEIHVDEDDKKLGFS